MDQPILLPDIEELRDRPQGRFNVIDALNYLGAVRVHFSNDPDAYNQFLYIMKNRFIDPIHTIQRILHLFNGHLGLIQGFNTFLTPDYHILVAAVVTTPTDTVYYKMDSSFDINGQSHDSFLILPRPMVPSIDKPLDSLLAYVPSVNPSQDNTPLLRPRRTSITLPDDSLSVKQPTIPRTGRATTHEMNTTTASPKKKMEIIAHETDETMTYSKNGKPPTVWTTSSDRNQSISHFDSFSTTDYTSSGQDQDSYSVSTDYGHYYIRRAISMELDRVLEKYKMK